MMRAMKSTKVTVRAALDFNDYTAGQTYEVESDNPDIAAERLVVVPADSAPRVETPKVD